MRWIDEQSELTGLDIVLAREGRCDAPVEAKQPPEQPPSAWALRFWDRVHKSRTAAKRDGKRS